MTTDYSDAVGKVLASEETNIIELVRIAGLDPITAFRSGNWQNCDFSGRDLRGFDFSFSDLRGAKFDGAWTRGAKFLGARLDKGALSSSIDHEEIRQNSGTGTVADVNAPALLRKLRKAQSVDEGIRIIEEIDKAHIPIDAKHFSILLDKARKPEDADAGWQTMEKYGVVPDRFLYATKIENARSFVEARSSFHEMISRGIAADKIVLTQLAQKAERSSDVMNEITALRFDQFDNQLANKILEISGSKPELLKLVRDFERQWRFSPDIYTLGLQIAFSDRIGEVFADIARYKSQGANLSISTFEKCISSVSRFRNALKVLDWSIEAKTNVHINTITTTLAKAENLEEVQQVLGRAKWLNIRMNQTAATSLIARIERFEDAAKMFDDLEAELQPNLQMYTSLVRAAENFSHVRSVLDRISSSRLKGDGNFYAAVMKKVPDLPIAMGVLEDILSQGVRLNSNVLDAAMGRARDFDEANTLLIWMQRNRVNLDANLFMSFLALAPDYQLAKQIFSGVGGADAIRNFEEKQMLGRP